jgi:Rrf2 family protein
MAVISADPSRRYSTGRLAEILCVSHSHLAKVLQRLVREGLIESLRGPGGGFRLSKPRDEITLLDIFEAIEGPYEPPDCLMHRRTCGEVGCMFGDLVSESNRIFKEYMSGRTLEDARWIYALPLQGEGNRDEA